MAPRKKQRRRLLGENLEHRRVMTTYYIDPNEGDNRNSGLAETAAFETVQRFAYFDSADSRVAGHIALQPGDELVFMEGLHDYSDNSLFGNQSLFLRGVKGTEAEPIKLTARPGARLAPDVQSGEEVNAVYLLQSEHIVVSGFDISAKGNGILIAESSNIEVVDNFIHDVDGRAVDNMAGVHIVGSDSIVIRDNFLANNYDREMVGNQNNRHIVAFGTTDLLVTNNVMWNQQDDVGAGVEYKHLGGLEPDAQNPFTVTDNIISNANYVSIGTSAPNSVIRGNLILNSGFIAVADRGGPHQLSNELIEWNTIVNNRDDGDAAGLFVGASENAGYPLGRIHFRNNVVHDTRDYDHADRSTVNVSRYGDDQFFERLVTDGLFSADGNVYDTLYPSQFDVFGSDIGGNFLGSKGDFQAWQQLGYDVNGLAIDSGLNEIFEPITMDSTSAGWLGSGTARLALLSDSFSMREGETTTLRIVRNGLPLDQPMSVELSVNVDDVEIPSIVTIPAGEQFATFDIHSLVDDIAEPITAVQIRAQSCMFDATTWLQIVDVAPVPEDESEDDLEDDELMWCFPIEVPTFETTPVDVVDMVINEIYGPTEQPMGTEQPIGTEQLDNNPAPLPQSMASWERVDFNAYTGESGEGRFVVARAGNHEVFFDTLYGGTPTTYARDGQNVIASFAGLGFGGNVNTGQDGTQASANGIAFNPIAQLNDPETTALYNYYGRETGISENPDGSVSYTVRGFMPNYWQSHEMRDDAIPMFPGAADHNWLTLYHNQGDAQSITGDPTVPVIFVGTTEQPIGYNFLGNELLSDSLPWNQRLFSIPDGRVVFKTNISLVAAGADAWAGIRFRTQLPESGHATIHDAYQADGYSLNVNKAGDIQLLRQQNAIQTLLWSSNLNQHGGFDVNSVGGVSLEVRTHNGQPGWMQILMNGQAVAEVTDSAPLLGEHNGVVASTTEGRIRFGNREFYDVGYEHQTTYRLQPDGKLDLDMIVQLAEGVVSPRFFYRAGQHTYVNPNLFEADDREFWGESLEGRVTGSTILTQRVLPSPGGLTSLWVGNKAGDLGLSSMVLESTADGELADGVHALMQIGDGVMALHLNALPISASPQPILLSSIHLKAIFWTKAQ